MSGVLLLKCPQCTKDLRIPSEWVNTPMRCKHCGKVFQAQSKKEKSPATPPPPDQKGGNGKPSIQPPPLPQKKVSDSRPPVVASPPLAKPVEPENTSHTSNPSGDPFAGMENDGPTLIRNSKRTGRSKEKSKSPLLWGVLAMLLFGTAGGIAAFYYFEKNREEKTANNNIPENLTPKSGENIDKTHGKTDEKTSPIPAGQFPRRAMIVSVHNYLYANLVHGGPAGESNLNVSTFQRVLNNALRIPLNQIIHLSDEAAKEKKRTPIKSVIEKSVHQFLADSRAQDRIMLFFVGHGIELDGKAYLVPIEGDLENASTLIPLQWFYDELKQCKARQKIFVVDVARYSPTYGRERPDGGPMTAKFEEALKNPPDGVQVLSACSADQQSYETDDNPMGVFLTTFYDKITPATDRKTKKGSGALEGTISKPENSIPIDKVVEAVNKAMETELKGTKLQQVCKLYGKEKADGLPYDPKEPLAAVPVLPPPLEQVVNKNNVTLVKNVLNEIGTPAVKVTREDNSVRFDMLPPFEAVKMAKYLETPPAADSKIRPAVNKARAVLWAISAESTSVTPEMAKEIAKVKADLGVNLTVLRDGYRAPADGNAEGRFKDIVFKDEREVAKILGTLNDTLEMLDEAGGDREKESPRWQANYDYIKARVQEQIAYLYEYQSMLGSMRKEFPERDSAIHGGWRLASQTTLTGDSAGKKLANLARKTLDKMAKDLEGTPWEVLAKREKLTALGLEWKPAR